MSVRLSPDGHGLRSPVGSLLAAKKGSPSNSPLFPKTRVLQSVLLLKTAERSVFSLSVGWLR